MLEIGARGTIAGNGGREGGGRRAAEAIADGDEMLGRNDRREAVGIDRRRPAGGGQKGGAERGKAVGADSATGGDDGAGDVRGDLVRLPERQPLLAHQGVGELGDGNTGAANVLGDADRIDVDGGNEGGEEVEDAAGAGEGLIAEAWVSPSLSFMSVNGVLCSDVEHGARRGRRSGAPSGADARWARDCAFAA